MHSAKNFKGNTVVILTIPRFQLNFSSKFHKGGPLYQKISKIKFFSETCRNAFKTLIIEYLSASAH